MAEQEAEKTKKIDLGKNIVQVGRVFGVSIRNLIEGVICTFIVLLLISRTNFKPQIKVLLYVAGSILTMIGNIKGIKNKSLSQNIMAEIKFRRRKRKLHLRSPEYIREVVNGGEYADESFFEKFTRENKERINKFIQENRTK